MNGRFAPRVLDGRIGKAHAMVVGSLNALAPERAAKLGLSMRNETAAPSPEPQVATVEIVRPLARQARLRAATDILRSEPVTERLRLDIRV